MKKKETPVAGMIIILVVVLLGLFVAVTQFTGGFSAENQQTAKGPAASDEMLNASHILICHSGQENDRTQDEAIQLALKVCIEAKENPDSFSDMAEKYSDGPSKSRGGRLGNFTPDKMVAPFSAAVQKLQIGEVSDPVETKFGYHVILRQTPQ